MELGSQVRSMCIEINIHSCILVMILIPLLTILFPSLLLLSGATMLAHLFFDHSSLPSWLAQPGPGLWTAMCLILLCVSSAAVYFNERRAAPGTDPALLDPVGSQGEKLLQTVAALWSDMNGTANAPPPRIRWFPKMDIAAYAAGNESSPEIHVSAGLWKAVIKDDRTASAILAHEIAHLVFNDPEKLRWLSRTNTATRAVLVAVTATAAVTMTGILVSELAKAIAAGASFAAVATVCLRVAIAGFSVLILLPLCWLALLRQTAYLTSLIEIRADVGAASATSGLEEFTQTFADNENVRRSTHKSLLKAVFSPDFTHIPQRERLAILRTPEYIVTPKIRFFLFSILLAFLLPINFATPLVFYGMGNKAIMVGLAIAVNLSIVLMLLASYSTLSTLERISPRRCAILALLSCTVTAMTRINLEPVSYLLMSWPAGFGNPGMDWSSLGHDVIVTARDVGGRFRREFFNLSGIIAVFIAYLCMLMISFFRTLSSQPVARLDLAIAALACTAGSVIAASDISALFPFLNEQTLTNSGLGRTMSICFPLLFSLGALTLTRFRHQLATPREVYG